MSELLSYVPETIHDVPTPAHHYDSIALAEHVPWRAIDRQLQKSLRSTANSSRAYCANERAWLCREYAFAITDPDSRTTLLDMADNEVQTILATDTSLPRRSKLYVNARLQEAYGDVFRKRVAHEPYDGEIAQQLQRRIGQILIDFMHEDESLAPGDYGALSELIASYGLLQEGIVPHLSSPREEDNIIADDNHDFYVLFGCDQNKACKAPLSIKHRKSSAKHRDRRRKNRIMPVLEVRVGTAAMVLAHGLPDIASSLPPTFKENERWRPTRLLADIIACHTNEERLDSSEKQFLFGFTSAIADRVTAFADTIPAADYAANTAYIRHYTARYNLKFTPVSTGLDIDFKP